MAASTFSSFFFEPNKISFCSLFKCSDVYLFSPVEDESPIAEEKNPIDGSVNTQKKKKKQRKKQRKKTQEIEESGVFFLKKRKRKDYLKEIRFNAEEIVLVIEI